MSQALFLYLSRVAEHLHQNIFPTTQVPNLIYALKIKLNSATCLPGKELLQSSGMAFPYAHIFKPLEVSSPIFVF